MLDIFRGEWKLFLKKWLMILLIASVCAVAAGFILIKVVLIFEPDATYIHAGTIFMLYVAVLYSMIFMGNLANARFNLLVSFGKKRSGIINYTIITSLVLAVLIWGITLLVNIFERIMYPVFFKGNELEHDFISFTFFEKYGLVIMVFALSTFWFVCALMRRFGGQIIAWIYLVIMAGVVVYTKFDLGGYVSGNSIASTIAGFFAGIPAIGWVCMALLLSAIFIVIGYNILRKYDLKF